MSLNLARRPFVNTRPVTRLALLLWFLGALLLFGNVSLFWSYLSGSAEKRADLERLEQDVQRQQKSVADLEQKLALLDLEQQNKQVQYLNLKIGERVFSWSLLFDRFAQVLPNDVRLTRLTPKVLRKKGRGVEEEGPADGRVQLSFQVEAKSDEAFFDFVNRMFEHDAFANPDFTRESREEGDDVLAFDVQVTYFPNRQSPPAEPAAPAGAPAPAEPGAGR
ncbi:MAG TPA: hypothetical protein DD490_02765 [Acidobacteria bacterium]|nr:hypothetical protein [Acidobacteriota bacterium]